MLTSRPDHAVRVLAAALAFVPVIAAAQTYPSRPIRIIVPLAPGGTGDTLARFAAAKLSEAFNQQVVVDNRLGANGIIGTDLVAKAAPDGYTLLSGSTAQIVINPVLYGKIGRAHV